MLWTRIFGVLILFLALPAGADGLNGDSAAIRNCRAIPSASVRNLCLDYAKGHRFHPRALELCARGRDYADDYGPFTARCIQQIRDQEFDRDAVISCERVLNEDRVLDCLQLVANRKTEKPEALALCDRQQKDDLKIECLKRLIWLSLKSTPIPQTSVDSTIGEIPASK